MEYLEKLLKLVQLENEEDLKQYRTQMLETPLRERKKYGKTWHPVQIHAKDYGMQQLQLTLERKSNFGASHSFQVGSLVTFYSTAKDSDKHDKLSGTVLSSWSDSVKVGFRAEELPDWADDNNLGLDLLFDSVTYKEMERALKRTMEAKEGRLKELRQVLLGEKAPEWLRESEQPHFQSLPNLNESQNLAIRNILNAKDIAIIHGPPGTGKTTTIVQAIKQTLQHEKQVLVCAPSNTAVDLLTEKLAEKGLKVLRIGNPAKITDSLMHHSLDGQMAEHPEFKRLRKMRKEVVEYKNLAHKYKRSFGKDEREQRKLLFAESRKVADEIIKVEDYIVKNLADSAQVILSTLVGVANRYIRNRTYSTVFIDESAQALEPATWIPITKSNRVILAGDHQQLPPTVKSSEAKKQGLEITMLERLVEKKITEAQSIEVMLDTQYRMNEQIMEFSNQQFYHGNLKAHESVSKLLLADESDFILGKPVEFIDTAGCGFEESRQEKGSSTLNKGEADLLLKHFAQLTEHITENHSGLLKKDLSVGVISPYKAQVSQIQSDIKHLETWEQFAPITQISSVDGFQGQEKSIIYISLVRSNENGVIGFLQDTRRMNVALTRAKQKLVVIGDSATLGGHKFYKGFLDYIDSVGGYRSAWEWLG
ncbi:MAG: superfamily I DNA and/or RNA helicase [Flammeovirgaceae bacterium]|jgi:superfamily I DNA and/or RNA helicase